MRRKSIGAAALAAVLAAAPALAEGPGGGTPPYPKLGGPGPAPDPAPAPSPAGPSSEQKLKDFVVGRWVNGFVDPVGSTITTDYRYAADGTGTGSLTNTSPYGEIKYYFKGKWSLVPISETSFALRVEMDGDMIIRATDELTIVDANTLANATTKTNMKRTP